MSKCLPNNLSDMQGAQPAVLAAKELLAHAMAPIYRVLLMACSLLLYLWL
ncbi:hypothetical protein [Polynucleobacter necessarius]|nr:hypothetical protein [Polynucleobacter necessarius]